MQNNLNLEEEKGGKMNGQDNTRNEAEAKTKNKKFKYFFKEKFVNEYDAFAKYFTAISTNGIMLSIIKEMENMGNYCDLFNDVNKDFYKGHLNLYSDPIPPEEENSKILYASSVVELVDSRDRGRALVSNTVIPRNKILIFEPPVILQVKPLCTCVGDRESSLYRCHNCGTSCKMFFTCDGCNICLFCSRTCMVFAYTNYHRYECYGLQRHFWSMEDTDYSYLSLRMMLYGASKDFKTDPEVREFYGNVKNNYPFVYMLETNFNHLSLSRINEVLYSCARNLLYLIRKTTFFDIFVKKKVSSWDAYCYVGGLMVRHYCQAQANNVILKYPNLGAGIGINVISGSGKAICPTISLLNHSCTPNAAIMVYYDCVVVKSVKKIQAGEEITICYKEIDALLPMAERKIITEEIFYFTCNCFFCIYERTWEDAPYRCQVCHIGNAKKIVLENNKVKGFCTRCCRYFNFNEIIEALKVATVCQNLYKATYAPEHVARLAECYNQIYPINSWKLLDLYKLLYEKHVLADEKPMEAIKYGMLSFSILENYITRLHLPILIAKVMFVIGVTRMKNFTKLKMVTSPDL